MAQRYITTRYIQKILSVVLLWSTLECCTWCQAAADAEGLAACSTAQRVLFVPVPRVQAIPR